MVLVVPEIQTQLDFPATHVVLEYRYILGTQRVLCFPANLGSPEIQSVPGFPGRPVVLVVPEIQTQLDFPATPELPVFP